MPIVSASSWTEIPGWTAKVGGGVLWGGLDAATQAHALDVPGGRVTTTGVGGFTTGGGYGWTSCKHGLACENLVSVEVVLADGRVVRAGEDEHVQVPAQGRPHGASVVVESAQVIASPRLTAHPERPESDGERCSQYGTWRWPDCGRLIERGRVTAHQRGADAARPQCPRQDVRAIRDSAGGACARRSGRGERRHVGNETAAGRKRDARRSQRGRAIECAIGFVARPGSRGPPFAARAISMNAPHMGAPLAGRSGSAPRRIGLA